MPSRLIWRASCGAWARRYSLWVSRALSLAIGPTFAILLRRCGRFTPTWRSPFQCGICASMRDAGARQRFRDILRNPTVLIWDHGALQFSQLLLAALPKSPAEASQGCIARLRSVLDHPLFLHCSPDRGHVAVMHQLGILDAGKVRPFVHFAFPAYTDGGYEPPPGGDLGARVAFAGNVYLEDPNACHTRANRSSPPSSPGCWRPRRPN